MKRKSLLTLVFVFTARAVWACPVCDNQQPALTRGLTHGVGAQSNWDWVIIGVITAITIFTLIYSVKFLVKPGEKNSNHIKNSILSN